MLRHEPWTSSPSIDSTMAGLWKWSTSFEATMPMTPRCQPSPATTSTLCAPTSGSVSTSLRASATIVASSSWRFVFSTLSCSASAARLVPGALVGGEQQPRGDVRRGHAAGGVDARRQQEADVEAVERLAGQARSVEQRPQPDRVLVLRQALEAEPGDDAVLADQRHDVGDRADGGDLEERRQPLLAAALQAQAVHHLQRHADAGEVLVGIRAVGPLRVDHRERRAAASPRARGGR